MNESDANLKDKTVYSSQLNSILQKINSFNFQTLQEGEKNKLVTEICNKLMKTGKQITKCQLIETHYRKSEEKYRHLYESNLDGIAMTDMEFNYIDCNQAYLDMLGYSIDEIKNLNFKKTTPEKWFEDDTKAMVTIIKKGHIEGYEKEFIRKNGTTFLVNMKAFLIKNSKEKPIGIWAIIRDITERKKAYETLREREHRFRSTFESKMIGTFFWDINGDILDANEAFLEMFGFSKDDVHKKALNWREMTPQSYNEIDQKALEEIKTTGVMTPIEKELICKNGEQIPVLFGAASLPGYSIGGVAFVLDITEKKNTELAFEESRKKYRDLFENSPNPIIIASKEGKIIDCNSATLTTFGYSKSELIHDGIKIIDGFISLLLKEIQKLNRYIEFKIPPFNIHELKIRIKDGSFIWVKIQPSFIKIRESNFIYLSFHDITKYKRSENELKKLERIYEQLDALIENAPLAILLIHQNGEVIRANEEAHTLFDFPYGELIGYKVNNLFNTLSQDAVSKHYNQEIYNLSTPNKLEAQIKTKNGRSIEIELTSTILKVSEDIIVQSYLSDITERKSNEKNRQHLLDHLISSLEFKSKFLATMSHELRTPLNSLLGFSELLLMESYGPINIDQKSFLKDIKSSGEHLLSLIDSILDLSKIEAGKSNINLKKINLNEFIDEVKSIIMPLYSNKNLKFVVNEINENSFFTVDPLRFRQILYNLLSNSIKFSEEGVIKLKSIERSDHWEFQISDTGIGIAKGDYNLIFREFGRVDNDEVKKIPGAGLGLALTKRLVNLHGGEIWFKSIVGKGTTFFFTIPKVKSEIEDLTKKEGNFDN